MITDQHPEPQSNEEVRRMAQVAFIEKEITYWMTMVSMWVVAHLLDVGDTWPWWQNLAVGVAFAFVANLIAYGHVWKKEV